MTSAPAIKAAPRWRVYTSGIVLVLLVWSFLAPPYCYCPGFYIFLACLALVPLFCGPSLCRILAVAAIGYSLYAAHRDYEGQTRERIRQKELRSRLEHERHPTPAEVTPAPSPAATPSPNHALQRTEAGGTSFLHP